MNGWDIFQVYHPIHLHFTTSYDIFKYGKRPKSCTFEFFKSRRDKALFEQIAKQAKTKEEVGGLCVANFIQTDRWLYKELNDAWAVYRDWVHYRKNLKDNVNHDLNVLSEIVKAKKVKTFNELFEFRGTNKNPPLLQLYLHKKIIPETIFVLDNRYGFLSTWNTSSDPLVADTVFRLRKYKPFINFNKLEDQAVNG